MSAPGETEKPSATVNSAERLEWQSELDSAMSDLDSRLLHPRRRASDLGPQPTLPELGQFDVTKELLDEISWRVAEQLRRSPVATAPVSPTAAASLGAPAAPVAPAALVAPVALAAPAMPHGAALVIRMRRPRFRWPFNRRRSKRQSMISLLD